MLDVGRGEAPFGRVSCLAARKMRTLLRRPSLSAHGKHESFVLVKLLCSDNTEIRRVVGLAPRGVELKRAAAMGLRKGNGGVEMIPLSAGRIGGLELCVRRGGLFTSRCEYRPLFPGPGKRELAEVTVLSVIGERTGGTEGRC